MTAFFATLTGVYGGYFGAGSGVMMMAVLGLGTDLAFRIVNALKTLAVMAANVVASVIFVVVADLDWRAVVLLAAGSVVGGYVGARIGRRLPASLLRAGSSSPGSSARSCSGADGGGVRTLAAMRLKLGRRTCRTTPTASTYPAPEALSG